MLLLVFCFAMLYLFFAIYFIVLGLKRKKLINDREKMTYAAFPELNSRQSKIKRKKQIAHYLLQKNPTNRRNKLLLFIMRISLYYVNVVGILKLLSAINNGNAVSFPVFADYMAYIGIGTLILGSYIFLNEQFNEKNDSLLKKYLLENPSNDLKITPISDVFLKKYYVFFQKVYQLHFLFSGSLLLPKILVMLFSSLNK